MAQTTFNATVSGGIRRYGPGTWASIRDGNGTGSSGGFDPTIGTDSSLDVFTQIARSFFIFDTSALTSDATITAATLSIYVTAKQSQLSGTVNLYKATIASDTAIVDADFQGTVANTTANCDTAIAYSAFTTSAYNDFVLNATGLTNISKTGKTKLGLRDVKDAANTAPTWSSSVQDYINWTAFDGANPPKIVVTYTLPSSGFFAIL